MKRGGALPGYGIFVPNRPRKGAAQLKPAPPAEIYQDIIL